MDEKKKNRMETVYILLYKYSFHSSYPSKLKWLLSMIISILFCLKYQHVGIGIVKKRKPKSKNGRRRGVPDENNQIGVYWDIAFGTTIRKQKTENFIADELIEISLTREQRRKMEKYLKEELNRKTKYNYRAFCCNFLPFFSVCTKAEGYGLLCTQLIANCLLHAGLVKNSFDVSERLRRSHDLKVGELVNIVLENVKDAHFINDNSNCV